MDAEHPPEDLVRSPEDLSVNPLDQRFDTEQVIGGKRSLKGAYAHTIENEKAPRLRKDQVSCTFTKRFRHS